MKMKALLKLGLVLAVLTVFCVAVIGAGSATDSWNGDIATKFAGGEGTPKNPYQIATGAQLAYLAQQTNSGNTYSGKYFKLTDDINLNSRTFTPIGQNADCTFQGTFDGNGKTISNLSVISYENFAGLFGVLGDKASIKNLNLKDCTVSGKDHVGTLVGELNNGTITIENCAVTNATVTGTHDLGGLVGKNYRAQSTIKDCTVTNVNVNGSDGDCHGGLLGYCQDGKLTITNCNSDGSISGRKYTGGLIGRFNEDKDAYINSRITECSTKGYVTGFDIDTGGLIGLLEDIGKNGRDDYELTRAIIANCSSSATVKGKNATAGLIGCIHDSHLEVSNCYTSGNVNGDGDYVGGLLGDVYYGDGKEKQLFVKKCYSTGNVTGKSNTGGLIAWIKYDNDSDKKWSNFSVTDSFSTGDVSGDVAVGGIMGFMGDKHETQSYNGSAHITLSHCYATGSVTGDSDVGGIVGNLRGSNEYPNNVIVEECLALNKFIKCDNDNCGRIAAGELWYYTTSDNRAWDQLAIVNTKKVNGDSASSEKIWNTYGTASSVWVDYSTDTWILGDSEVFELPILRDLPKPVADASHLSPMASRIEIKSVEDLKAYAEKVNNGQGKIGDSLVLMNDLNLDNQEWTPIGNTEKYPFRGTFDGNGKTISNLSISSVGDYPGLFGVLGDKACIKNLNLKDCKVSGRDHVGTLVGELKDGTITIENCTVTNATVSGNHDLGGLIGKNYRAHSTIKN